MSNTILTPLAIEPESCTTSPPEDDAPAPAEPLFTTHVCKDNSELIARVAKLYLKVGDRIADVTYGKGVFWKRVDLTRYDFLASDVVTVPERRYDLRNLPYGDGTLDVVVIDLPYSHHGQPRLDKSYQGMTTTAGANHDAIIDMYIGGMIEATRVLHAGGTLWVKIQDEIESGYQRWSHVEVLHAALALGLFAKDLFVMVQAVNPLVQQKEQKHARKNSSYLWIFKKPSAKEMKDVRRLGLLDIATSIQERVTAAIQQRAEATTVP